MSENKIVWIVSGAYPGFSEDLKPAFRECGWDARYKSYDELLELNQKDFLPNKPDLLFGIVFNQAAYELAQEFKIVYGFWEIDKAMAPEYFSQKLFENMHFFATYKDDLDHPSLPSGANAHYLPYCPNIADRSEDSRVDKYKYDVTFVGSPLLEKGNEFPELISFLEETARDEPEKKEAVNQILVFLNEILETQKSHTRRNKYKIPELVKVAINELKIQIGEQVLDSRDIGNLLGKQAASDQRLSFIRGNTDVQVFGNDEWKESGIGEQRFHGSVPLREGAAEVFCSSKINLNLQRIYALDGVSDRVFGVMAAGGFMLSNNCPGITDLFEPGTHLDVFDSPEEMDEKIAYYIKNDDERIKIATAGRKEVLENQSLENRISSALLMMDLPSYREAK